MIYDLIILVLYLGKVVEKVVNGYICSWIDGNPDQAAGLNTGLLHHTDYLYIMKTKFCLGLGCMIYIDDLVVKIYEMVEKRTEQIFFLIVV